jgi:hypothetical protein
MQIVTWCTNHTENYDLLGCYTASSGNSLPTFLDNLSVPSARVKNAIRAWYRNGLESDYWRLKKGTMGRTETSVRNYHYWLRNSAEVGSFHLFRGETLINA